MSEPHAHRYVATCSWQGSTGAGYERYDRTHRAVARPAKASLELTADSAFRGRAELLNPEQLLLLAASSCQLLSFLAVAARARLDVVGYEDDAEAVMPADNQPMRITDIWLRPAITAHSPATDARVRHLAEVAHRECFIANSLTCQVHVEPKVTILL